jgi:anti-anti-sigma regulatory factor
VTVETHGRMKLDAQPGELRIAGSLDESSALLDLLGRARGGRLVLDLAGVTFINSLGVRDWIRMLAQAQQQQLDVELRRVAEPIVHQLNMIVAARGKARVTAFYAPYACDACGREDSLLIDAVEHRSQLAKLASPAQTCSECGAKMVFSDFPERYFSFLSDV